MGLNQRMLRHIESRYPEEEDMYCGEIERLESLPTAFDEGTWSQEDLEWIIAWKAGIFTEPILKYLRSNNNSEIRARVNQAVNESDIRSKVEALISLKGVGVPVASAILLFINPDRFTVIDKRAWNVLHKSGYLPDKLSETPTVEQYLLYLGVCWTLANEYNLSIRTLDRALWILDIEEEKITDG